MSRCRLRSRCTTHRLRPARRQLMSKRSLWVAIDSRPDETRILATAGPQATVLKARLSATAHHPRAVPALLEALAMWEGRPVRGVVVVGGADDSSVTRLKLDFLTDVSGE